MKRFYLLLILLLPLSAAAQHHNHTADTVAGNEPTETPMSHGFSLELPMNRNASGTGWLPDASPMYGYMHHAGKWMFMSHGNITLRYTMQDVTNQGQRGSDNVSAPNWLMTMGQRRVGANGMFRFSAMLSLDPLTIGGYGYPLLFQTGETWQGKPLVDRQHPHDLFSELSVGYTQRFAPGFEGFVYVGFPGEPALGPAAFMHRPSALFNPDAPLGHHSQDATHIVFGTTTLGLRYRAWKLEGSLFSGTEPDENRYAFQTPQFDSWAIRGSFTPHRTLVLQAGFGQIANPEGLVNGPDVQRATASAVHSLPLAGGQSWLSTSAVWGLNRTLGGHEAHTEQSFLLESTFSLRKNAVYARYEWVQRGADELGLTEAQGFAHHGIYNVNVLTLGYNRTLAEVLKTRLAVGAQVSVHVPDAALTSIYGQNPLSGQIYLQIYPGRMN